MAPGKSGKTLIDNLLSIFWIIGLLVAILSVSESTWWNVYGYGFGSPAFMGLITLLPYACGIGLLTFQGYRRRGCFLVVGLFALNIIIVSYSSTLKALVPLETFVIVYLILLGLYLLIVRFKSS